MSAAAASNRPRYAPIAPDPAARAHLLITDRAAVDPAALAEVDWDRAVIRPVPSLARLPLATNADAIWLALAQDLEIPEPVAEPGTLMIWRQGFEPVMRRFDADEAMILDASQSGHSFAEICALLAQSRDEAEAVTIAGTVLGRWIGESIVAGLD